MLALSTATEVTSVIAIFFVLLALLTLLRLILRKEEPLWKAIRVGVFIERVPHEERRPPTTWQKPE